MTIRTTMIALSVAALLVGCTSGDDDQPIDALGAGGGDAGTGGDDTTGGATGGGAVDSGAGDAGGGNNSCEKTADCIGGNDVCIEGVCLFQPVNAMILVDNRTDDEVESAPNLDCVGGAVTAPADGPETTTIYGIVDRFGGGRQTINIQVSVFLASEWPPAECTSLPLDEQRECFRNLVPKAGWSAVSTDPTIGDPPIPATCTANSECPAGYECIESDPERKCDPQFGVYEIKGIPTNELLVIRSRNDESAALFDSKWKDTYVWGVYLYSDKVDDEGRYRTNALMVSDSQWKTIPNTLFVAGGIKKGNGAIGGRIRDCRGADRPSFTMGWASVNAATAGTAIGYFNDNEQDTVPLVDKKGTDIFGRFTIVDVPAGPNKIAAAIRLDGKTTSLGAEVIHVVPDSLSVVAFPGKLAILNK